MFDEILAKIEVRNAPNLSKEFLFYISLKLQYLFHLVIFVIYFYQKLDVKKDNNLYQYLFLQN